MGLVEENNKVNFYDGKVRVVGPDGRRAREVRGQGLPRHLASTSSLQLPRLPVPQVVGWKGFVDGKDCGRLSRLALSRLNASDGMATPLAQAEYERFL